MSKKRKFTQPKPQQLLVEGKNDQHVIWALCKKYKLPETFSVELPNEDGTEGVEALLSSLTARLKDIELKTLGIVVDADQNLQARWQSISDKLKIVGYQNIPHLPCPEGWIDTQSELPKIGVWIMPNNQLPGILEDFVTYLIPTDDQLHPKAIEIIDHLEQLTIHRYGTVQRPKALIHTWLAWQEKPGIPMGQAITAQVLTYHSSITETFITWLNQLFN
ncbi:hypothetical protein PCC7424_1862 [Gloeothece citriformis PCC 7424]|uniref:DUF4435 domain-containing protein n=1 Tax=Gloeothece citriformis (strain PCC 7424) TaxID=65393 RepID=B7KDJ2_GLOC7|nr:DUF3226 domain-containing protein [Gloeothece citriformis]ACK70294.1 hypothetical protein PCC7424_1862 [Gloeothece citriformis PCC 7424]